VELRKVILRYLDGRVVPAYAPLFEEGTDPVPSTDLGGAPLLVPLAELKAVFFVRTFSGNPAYDPPKNTSAFKPVSGRPIVLSFQDGERVLGEARDLARTDRGFYLTVLDPEDNNLLIYVNPGALSTPPEEVCGS
jgi:hypothetical protein